MKPEHRAKEYRGPVVVEQAKKRGPKPRHGEDNPCTNKNVSMPITLWDWCVGQALFTDSGSVSRFIVDCILKEQRRLAGKTKKK